MVKVLDNSHKDLGKVEISPEVLISIASIATSEIDGLHGHFAELKNASPEKLNRKNLTRGIKLETKDDGIYIDVFCEFKYVINIFKTATKIQKTIFNSLSTMTTIVPKQINIHSTHIEVENTKK
ncbi:Asp23/Gls24 family envelope stress response protein [Staphylococcus condimenti]|uniref:Asp23/Gls24 family envelope stress response protein n=1 Tax=Staphylococcus condimenti TaxID=70255 RepID=UPI001022AB06|nr:Asp23/Gls24 family envelope stress response protein [Staphylococcus condimenti]RZI05151.1 Asp23/Gls24 family envelope stress response protein [Staphylococcus condimenti]